MSAAELKAAKPTCVWCGSVVSGPTFPMVYTNGYSWRQGTIDMVKQWAGALQLGDDNGDFVECGFYYVQLWSLNASKEREDQDEVKVKQL